MDRLSFIPSFSPVYYTQSVLLAICAIGFCFSANNSMGENKPVLIGMLFAASIVLAIVPSVIKRIHLRA